MSANRWNASDHQKLQQTLQNSGKPAFSYSRQAMINQSGKVADSLNPARGINYSKDLPGIVKTPVSILIDVTGSGQRVPGIVFAELPKLMGLMTIQDAGLFPDIQFAGIGNAHVDRFPFQFSEFESEAVRIDEALTSMILEGGGGDGKLAESFTEALWYITQRNQLDCWANGKRATAIIIGDENSYDYAYSRYINQHMLNQGAIGDLGLIVGDTPAAEVFRQVIAKYNLYFIVCGGSSNYDEPWLKDHWQGVLETPEHFIKLPDPHDIAPMISSLVLFNNGMKADRIKAELATLGSGSAVSAALDLMVMPSASPSQATPFGTQGKLRRI